MEIDLASFGLETICNTVNYIDHQIEQKNLEIDEDKEVLLKIVIAAGTAVSILIDNTGCCPLHFAEGENLLKTFIEERINMHYEYMNKKGYKNEH